MKYVPFLENSEEYKTLYEIFKGIAPPEVNEDEFYILFF
jgi:hypothetical protein